MKLQQLSVWLDPQPRPGPEAMAVDEWLLETTELPVLRVYQWQGAWGSIGYFGDIAAAKTTLPGVDWVRRWTGGGTVDHRADWTYTLVLPAGCTASPLPGAESYRWIHQALATALQAEGLALHLATAAAPHASPLCFENPVGHDLLQPDGGKMAGAGQRRTRRGLLHQGSVALPCNPTASAHRAEQLAASLANHWHRGDLDPPADWISHKISQRYAHPQFLSGPTRRSGELAGQQDGGNHR